MPGGNRKGPRGEGPMTGRAAGYCAGNGGPGAAAFASQAMGGQGMGGQAGGGRGGGRGGSGGRRLGRVRRGRRRQFRGAQPVDWQPAEDAVPATVPESVASLVADLAPSAAPSPLQLDELVALRELTADLTQSLGEIERRLKGLEARTQSE